MVRSWCPSLRHRAQRGCGCARIQVLQRGYFNLQRYLLQRGEISPVRSGCRERLKPRLLLPGGSVLATQQRKRQLWEDRQPVQHPEASPVRFAAVLLTRSNNVKRDGSIRTIPFF